MTALASLADMCEIALMDVDVEREVASQKFRGLLEELIQAGDQERLIETVSKLFDDVHKAVCRLALFAGFCPTIKAGFRGRDARRAWGLEVQQRDRGAHDRAIDRRQLLLVGEEQREAEELAGEPR